MQTTIWKYSREIVAERDSEEAALDYVVELHPGKTVTSRKPPFDPGLLVYVDNELHRTNPDPNR